MSVVEISVDEIITSPYGKIDWGLPPGTIIIRWCCDWMTRSYRAQVVFPLDWCVVRVSGKYGDMVNADFDFDQEGE